MKKVSELTKKEKWLVRQKRFGGSEVYANLDSNQILAALEDEKKKRQERAQKFGLGDTEETIAEKRKERIARFKQDQQGGASGEANISEIQDEKERKAARIARFGGELEDK